MQLAPDNLAPHHEGIHGPLGLARPLTGAGRRLSSCRDLTNTLEPSRWLFQCVVVLVFLRTGALVVLLDPSRGLPHEQIEVLVYELVFGDD